MEPSEPPPQDAGFNSGGYSPQTAIFASSIREEYAWVAKNFPGARLVHQSLTYFEGKPFDVLTLTIEMGDELEVFFDISSFFGRERGGRSTVAPCPYCGAAFRTERAKQCLECGTDWRDPAKVIRRGEA
jgi:hypothetical protein